MLVLTRKESESILIGEDVKITIVAIDRGKVRIGITAPKEIPVYREELLDAKNGTPGTMEQKGKSAA